MVIFVAVTKNLLLTAVDDTFQLIHPPQRKGGYECEN